MLPLIIRHQVKPGVDCPDGSLAAYSAAKAFEFKADHHPEHYRSEQEWKTFIIPFEYENRTLILVDFAGYPLEIMQELSQKAGKVIVIDHHISAKHNIELLSDSFKTFDGNYTPNRLGCGATTTWTYFHPEKPMPWFFNAVMCRDTGSGGYWDGELFEEECITATISKMCRGKRGAERFPIYDSILDPSKREELIEEGKPEVVKKNVLSWAEVEKWRAGERRVSLDVFSDLKKDKETTYPAVPYHQITEPEAMRHYSWIGAYLAKANPEAPYVLIQTGDDRSISLRKRSNSPVDLSKIAANFGGGGHFGAAGFSF